MKEGAPGRRTRGTRTPRAAKADANGATVGFEPKLWAAADLLRGNLDPGEYKHVVLGLIFLKYISDAFEARRAELAHESAQGADPDDPDEYRAEHVFWVPRDARWPALRDAAKTPEIGQLIDRAMEAVERENKSLQGVLPKNFGRPDLDKRRLGELIDLLGTIEFSGSREQARDVLGRVYEYFLLQFAGREGRRGGEFYTPRSVVRLLVEMLQPYRGRVYDPCCGSSGMFVQSEEFIRAHGGRLGDISIFGQESNATTWRLAKMNLAIRGIEANLGERDADSFHADLHPDLRADYVLANPPFNQSDWGGEGLRDDVRWKYGVPPPGNANYGWVEHIVHHLAPNGIAGFILANGSLDATQSGEGHIREQIIEANLVDCIIALPAKLFYGAAIAACLWFVARDRSGSATSGGKPLRDRRGSILFIDARRMGVLVDRSHRELTQDDIEQISRTYHAWRGEAEMGAYADVPGFCASAPTEAVRSEDYVLVPSVYVGTDYKPPTTVEAMERVDQLSRQVTDDLRRSAELARAIREQLRELPISSADTAE